MKKITLFTLIILTSLTANAQDSFSSTANPQGNFGFLQSEIFVEGNFQLSSTNNELNETKSTSYAINPKAGYFISDDIAIGVQGAYTSSTEEEIIGTDTSITKSNIYSAGVFGRYYFLELGSRFYTYGELGGTYSTAKSSSKFNELNTDNDPLNTINANLSLGLNYFANENILITFQLSDIASYSTSKLDTENAKPISNLNINLNILDNFFQTAQFGIMFIID